jgi:hypothetical protein
MEVFLEALQKPVDRLSQASLSVYLKRFKPFLPPRPEDLMDTLAPTDDPATWNPALDALTAAPRNHRLLYEDDNIRVLSVSIEPGETEPAHHHALPSVFVIDRLVKLRDFNGAGKEIPLPIPPKFELPLTIRMQPQPLHYVVNEDTVAFHGTRIEFKNGFPAMPG